MGAGNIIKSVKTALRRFLAKRALDGKRYEAAHGYFLKALKSRPDDLRVHKGLALSAAGMGRGQEAIMRAEIAARIAPFDGDIRDTLARLYQEAGRQGDAEHTAYMALCLNPNLDSPALPGILRQRQDGSDLLALHDRLRKLSRVSTQNYGRYGFYQGFERLLLPGQRPVENRLESYALTGLLDTSMTALDIGCNCGFLSLCIAPHVAAITGVELDSRMVEVAEHTAGYLGQENASFAQGKFEDFQAETAGAGRRFDLIVATAVHMHVRYDIEEFASAIAELLRPGGLVLLESQDMRTVDWDFKDKIQRFAGTAFEELSRGATTDENGIPRLHAVLRLQAGSARQ